MSERYDPTADAARVTFRLGLYTGRLKVRISPYIDGLEFTLRMRAPDRDDPTKLTTFYVIRTERVDNADQFMALAQSMFKEAWRHEFNEGFMVDGVRVRDPHANEDAA